MKEIFVFGSNLAGRHGKGAALCAVKEHDAIYGQGSGLQGNSYAIPTKNKELYTLNTWAINYYVSKFILFAWNNPDLHFNVTPIGCGLAGYEPKDIAPMFREALSLPNVKLPKEFLEVLNA